MLQIHDSKLRTRGAACGGTARADASCGPPPPLGCGPLRFLAGTANSKFKILNSELLACWTTIMGGFSVRGAACGGTARADASCGPPRPGGCGPLGPSGPILPTSISTTTSSCSPLGPDGPISTQNTPPQPATAACRPLKRSISVARQIRKGHLRPTDRCALELAASLLCAIDPRCHFPLQTANRPYPTYIKCPASPSPLLPIFFDKNSTLFCKLYFFFHIFAERNKTNPKIV